MRFRYSVPKREQIKLLEWGARLRQHQFKRYKAFYKAMREVEYRLKFEADEWGEQYKDLKKIGLQLRFGAVDMIGVTYGVHEETRQVFISHFRWIGPDEPA